MTEVEAIRAWFVGRLPDDWFDSVDIEVDDEEIIVIGALPEPDVGEAGEDQAAVAASARVAGFRNDTKRKRIAIAREAEARFGRKVSWGVEIGGRRLLFTHLAVPAMTRLRMPERRVLDTLIASGVARSRSEALAWCVRQVGIHQKEWLGELEDALAAVEDVRRRGPGA